MSDFCCSLELLAGSELPRIHIPRTRVNKAPRMHQGSLCGMLRGASSRGHMPREGGCAVIRQGHLIAVVVTFLIAVLVFGCGAGGTGINDGRGGKRGAAATKEESTAPEGDRSKAQTAQKPVGLDAKVVIPRGQAPVPRGFGGGSLWATGEQISASASSSPPGAAGAGSGLGGPPKTLLGRLDPQTGEVVATIPIKDLWDVLTQVAVGAGSVWVSS